MAQIELDGELVIYDESCFEVAKGPEDKIIGIRYKGVGGKVPQPKGLTSYVSLFFWNTKIRELDLSDWDTTGVREFAYMFDSCTNLEVIKGIENFDVSLCSDFTGVFNECTHLKKLDLSKWNMNKAVSVCGMFMACTDLEEIDVSTWRMPECVDYDSFVDVCSKLRKLDVSKWDTSGAQTMERFACSCINLEELALENWNVSNLTVSTGAIANCPKLRAIDFSNWEISDFTIAKMYEHPEMKKLSANKLVETAENSWLPKMSMF